MKASLSGFGVRAAAFGAALVGTVAISSMAQASPILVVTTETNFRAVTTSDVAETFAIYANGFKPSPFVFSNGSTSSNPYITNDSSFCGSSSPSGKCLVNAGAADQTLNFSQSPTGVGFYTHFLVGTDILNVTVNSNDSSLSFSVPSATNTFLGFTDPSGITSVRVSGSRNPANTFTGNFSFTEVLTGSFTPPLVVPEPASLALLGMSVAGVAAVRWRRAS